MSERVEKKVKGAAGPGISENKAIKKQQVKKKKKSLAMPKKGKKRSAPGNFQYVPIPDPEPNSSRQFVVHVQDEWEAVSGFQVFELFTFQQVGEFSFGEGREWYCSNEIEPAEGFKKGSYMFVPKGKKLTALRFVSSSLQKVIPKHLQVNKLASDGEFKPFRKAIQIKDEQERVRQAYSMSTGQPAGVTTEEDEEDEEDEEEMEEEEEVEGDEDDEPEVAGEAVESDDDETLINRFGKKSNVKPPSKSLPAKGKAKVASPPPSKPSPKARK